VTSFEPKTDTTADLPMMVPIAEWTWLGNSNIPIDIYSVLSNYLLKLEKVK